jgi:hypothetical protein
MPYGTPTNKPDPSYTLAVTVVDTSTDPDTYIGGTLELVANYEDGISELDADDLFQNLVNALGGITGITAQGRKNLGTTQPVTAD